MGVTAIQDRLTITLQDAKIWLGLGVDYETECKVSINADPPDATDFCITINGTNIAYTSGTPADIFNVAAGIVNKITLEALTGITAITNGDGTYTIAGTSEFSCTIDSLQSLIANSVDETILETLITVAKQMADKFCNNPFYDRNENGKLIDSSGDELTIIDGVPSDTDELVEITIPEAVKTGVLQMLRLLWTDYQNSSGSDSGSTVTGKIKSEKTGDRSVSFETRSELSGSSSVSESAMLMPVYIQSILLAYRFVPGF